MSVYALLYMRVVQSSFYPCIPLFNIQPIDSHSENRVFRSVRRYVFVSFAYTPPPSRRTQQIQEFQRSGGGVCRFSSYLLKPYLVSVSFALPQCNIPFFKHPHLRSGALTLLYAKPIYSFLRSSTHISHGQRV